MSYIVTNYPAVGIRFEWNMMHSLDGVRYATYGDAMQQCKTLGACGVVEINDEKEVNNAETRNDSED